MESVVYNVTRDEDYVQPKNNAEHKTNYVGFNYACWISSAVPCVGEWDQLAGFWYCLLLYLLQ